MMKTPIHIFEEEFLSYCKDKMPFDSLSFGNMDYDFVLSSDNGKWLLNVYEVFIDHYGKPYRNELECLIYNVSNYFN